MSFLIFLFFFLLFLLFCWNMKQDRGNTFPHCHPLIKSLGLLFARFHLQPVWRAAGRADSRRRNDGLGSNSALLPRRSPPSNSSDFESKEYMCCHKIPICIRTQCSHWAEHLPSVDIKLMFSANILENTLIFSRVRPAIVTVEAHKSLKRSQFELSLLSVMFLWWSLSNISFLILQTSIWF